MASKRNFKKDLNKMVFEVVEECFSVQLFNESKTQVTNELIEEVINFRNNMTEKIHNAKTSKDFPVIRAEVEDAAVTFIHKLNELM
ncbi:MAG: hypothetical protein KA264_06060 [Crocinitomicaceae bacterium]|jgi:hypothetical protein|nr:hypothetical protein [Crocinitomicaceae bacterium]